MTAITPPRSGRIVSAATTISVGDWTATPALDVLERDGQLVKLQPRAMELLVYLARRPGEVVSAAELINSVWGGRSVGDGAVYRSVNQLRHALGDGADDSRYVQTIPKRGYRLVAPVSHPQSSPEASPAASDEGERAANGFAALRALSRQAVPFAATAIAAAVITYIAMSAGVPPRPLPVNRFEVFFDQPVRRSGRPVIALSPDGRHLIYNAEEGLYLRTMGELEAHVIPGTEPDLAAPFFSPDGQNVAYWARRSNRLERIALSGGTPVPIANDVSNLRGASWGVDGTILFGQAEGILRVAADGGTPELVIPMREGEWFYGPQLLPDGDSVLFSRASKEVLDWDRAQIVLESLSTGERTVLVEGGSDARYLPTGHLVYAVKDELFAVTFDLDSRTVSGGPVPLLKGLARAWGGLTAAANYAVADDGTLAYLIGRKPKFENSIIVAVDRAGRETPLVTEPGAYEMPRLSPDGRRLAVQIHDDRGSDIWILDSVLGTSTRLTFGPGDETEPHWTPDGTRVAFRTENGIYWKAADGSGHAEPLVAGPSWVLPHSFSPDSKHLVFGQQGQGWDIWMLPLEGERIAQPLIEMEEDQGYAAVSPDGRWIAYGSASPRTYRGEIYVRPFPDVEKGVWQVSKDGGIYPLWGPEGSELFFANDDTLFRVGIESEPSFRAGEPEPLFPINEPVDDSGSISPEGQLFVRLKALEEQSPVDRRKIIIVQNWFEELERLAPSAGVSQSTSREH